MLKSNCKSILINGIKTAVFICVFSLLFWLTGQILSVKFPQYIYDGIGGFYKYPDNTVETVFLGSSLMMMGVSPMELYDKYGICSYNLGSDSQPLIASYYLLCDAKRIHNDTLKNVVLDVTMLIKPNSDVSFSKVVDTMPNSVNRFTAICDYYGRDIETGLLYSIPLLKYHNRWTEINKDDYHKQFTYEYTGGYYFSRDSLLSNGDLRAEFSANCFRRFLRSDCAVGAAAA